MKRNVLVLAGDRYHPSDDVLEGLRQALGPEFAFELGGSVDQVDARFSAVVLAKMNVKSELDSSPWTTTEREGHLSEWVWSGKGLLVVHAGTVGYAHPGGIRQMTGGAFQHHPESCEVRYEGANGHTLSCEIAPFTVRDEHYFVEVDPGADLFLESKSVHGRQPAGWTKSWGEGRVCVLTPGHFADVWLNPNFGQLLNNSLRWAIGA